MSLQPSALPAARSPCFPITQQIWLQAWNAEEDRCMQSLCAKIACIVFPIICTVAIVEAVLLVGRKVVQLFSKQSAAPQGAVGETIVLLPPIKVDLQPGCSQFDIENNPADVGNRRPPACTFHALIGASSIAENFEKYVQWIESQDTANLSAMQRTYIIRGTGQYFGLIADHHGLKGGADLDDLKKYSPEFLIQRGIYLRDTNQDPQPIAARAAAIVEHLFAPPVAKQTQMAWIKNGNDESFSVICNQDRAIVFDSHKKSIFLIRGKEQTQRFLTENLAPFANVVEGSDLNAFSYSLGYVENST